MLSGTPATKGTFTFTIKASGFAACTSVRQFTLTINGSCPAITPPSLPETARLGVDYLGNLATTSPTGTYIFTLDSGVLPPGLAIDNLFAILVGTPTSTGTYQFTLKATLSNGCTGMRAYVVTIANMTAAQAQMLDYDGDGKSDLSLWSANTGRWLIALSQTQHQKEISWGGLGDVPLPGDYDGDGKSDLAIFRSREAVFFVQRSIDGAHFIKQWGQAGDIPVPGDYDGDHITDLAVWHGRTGQWQIRRSSDGEAEITAWGNAETPYLDIPVSGDYDGDGRTDIAVFRRASGTWLIRYSSTGEYCTQAWGRATDTLVQSDYDGDGKTDIAVWRQGTWYILQSATQAARIEEWGASAAPYFDHVAPGDYDSDGKTDLSVWRASTQTWYIRASKEGTIITRGQGNTDDLPITYTPRL